MGFLLSFLRINFTKLNVFVNGGETFNITCRG